MGPNVTCPCARRAVVQVWERLNIAEPGATVAVDSETRFFIPDGLRVTGPTYAVRENLHEWPHDAACNAQS